MRTTENPTSMVRRADGSTKRQNTDWVILGTDDYAKVPPLDGQAVMDVGAHIGLASRRFLAKGADKVTCFEPSPANYAMLARNMVGLPATIHNLALGIGGGPVTLWESNDNAQHSLWHRRTAAREVRVRQADFWDELERIAPDVLKIDIEGGEWLLGLDVKPLPPDISMLIGEWHTGRKAWKEIARATYAAFTRQGFRPILAPSLKPYFGHTIGIWSR